MQLNAAECGTGLGLWGASGCLPHKSKSLGRRMLQYVAAAAAALIDSMLRLLLSLCLCAKNLAGPLPPLQSGQQLRKQLVAIAFAVAAKTGRRRGLGN